MKLREENEKLQRTRSDMDEELHTLTENLFEVSSSSLSFSLFLLLPHILIRKLIRW